MNNPKISIIVPVYNSERYLECCIRSILNQSFKDFELLLINDGSLDNSLVICSNYAEKDERVRIFNKKNGGVSSARNLGIREARGEWVTFVDADDILYHDALSHLAECTLMGNLDFVTAGFEYINADETITYTTENLRKGLLICKKNEGIANLYENEFWQWFICSKMFRLSLLKEQHLLFNEGIYYAEDRLFILQYVLASHWGLCFSSKSIYKYRMHSTSAIAQQKNKLDFNEKSISGFEASVLMYKEIVENKPTLYNKYLALTDVVISYNIIKKMMLSLSFKPTDVDGKLNPILNKVMSVTSCYCLSVIRLFLNRFGFIKNIFKKIAG